MQGNGRAIGLVSLAMALVMSTAVVAATWALVKMHQVNSVQVTGSAKRRIRSDLVLWRANLQARSKDATDAYRQLSAQVKQTVAYFKAQGVKDDEIRIGSVHREEMFETTDEVTRTGEHIQKRVFTGYALGESVEIQSTDVLKVERLSREVSALMEQGVPVDSEAPRYLYTHLGELKIEMLAEASRDARVRAERMLAAAAEARVGRLRSADMGVINVNPADSTETSWAGNNDTTSLDKDIFTIVHCTFELAQ